MMADMPRSQDTSITSRQGPSARINWRQIAATGVITLIVALLSGVAMHYYQTPKLRLAYYLSDTIPFEQPNNNLAVYHTQIANEGDQMLEDVVLNLLFSSGKVAQHHTKCSAGIFYSDTVSEDSYYVQFKNLNPHEVASISVLVTGHEQLPSRPQISLRAKGVTGTEAITQGKKPSDMWVFIAISVLAAYAGLFLAAALWKKRWIQTIGSKVAENVTFTESKRGDQDGQS